MEKIKINETTLDLIPVGISESDKRRYFTISSDLSHAEIEAAFTDVTNIQYLSEAGEVLVSYLDGVSVKSISKNYDDGTYTIEISTDAVEAQLKALQAQIDALKAN